jgi:hypothetical protein
MTSASPLMVCCPDARAVASSLTCKTKRMWYARRCGSVNAISLAEHAWEPSKLVGMRTKSPSCPHSLQLTRPALWCKASVGLVGLEPVEPHGRSLLCCIPLLPITALRPSCGPSPHSVMERSALCATHLSQNILQLTGTAISSTQLMQHFAASILCQKKSCYHRNLLSIRGSKRGGHQPIHMQPSAPLFLQH